MECKGVLKHKAEDGGAGEAAGDVAAAAAEAQRPSIRPLRALTPKHLTLRAQTAPAMPLEAEASDVAQRPSAPGPGPWQQTAHGKGRVRPRKNAPAGADVPRLAAVAHRCAAAAAAAQALHTLPRLCTCHAVCCSTAMHCDSNTSSFPPWQ